MRLSPRLLFAGSVASIALACSGAVDQDVLSESSGSSTSSASSSGLSSGTTTSSSGETTSGSSGTSSSGASNGGPPNDGGKPLPATCIPEEELNNEPNDANQFKPTGSICGSLLPGTDTDYVTFTLPSGTKTMDLTFSGNVKLRIFVEGAEQVELSPTSNPPIPFVVGKPYIVRITNAGGAAAKVDWRVNVVIGP